MDSSVEFRGIRERGAKRSPVTYVRTSLAAETLGNRTGTLTSPRLENPYLLEGTGSSILLKHILNARLQHGFADILKLEDNWDSYGAIAPTATTVARAKNIAEMFPEQLQPEIYPETNGAIGLYWDYRKIYCIRVHEKPRLQTWFIEEQDGSRLTPSLKQALEFVALYFLGEIKKSEKLERL